jgi:HPt (histidine-containing phosphotransfer) domain-containing protein
MTEDRDSSFIAESLPIFIGEAQEQIESIEQLLLQLEDAPTTASCWTRCSAAPTPSRARPASSG